MRESHVGCLKFLGQFNRSKQRYYDAVLHLLRLKRWPAAKVWSHHQHLVIVHHFHRVLPRHFHSIGSECSIELQFTVLGLELGLPGVRVVQMCVLQMRQNLHDCDWLGPGRIAGSPLHLKTQKPQNGELSVNAGGDVRECFIETNDSPLHLETIWALEGPVFHHYYRRRLHLNYHEQVYGSI